MMNKWFQTVCAGVLLSGSQVAFASDEPLECNSQNFINCMNGVGPAVTNPDSMRISASRVSKQIKDRTDENENLALLGTSARSGLSAGENFSGLGVWGSFSFADFSADIPVSNASLPIASYDADQISFFAGVDKIFMNKLVLGLSLGYEKTDIDTAYNGGNNETDGFTIAPYGAYLINKYLSVDVAGGYSSLSTDTDRLDNVSGGTIVGGFDSNRWFVSSNLNANVAYGKWLLGGRLGLLYTEEDQDAYAESGPNTARTIGDRRIDLTQGLIGFDIGYQTSQFEPYATFTYLNDMGRDNGTEAGGLPGAVGATQPVDDDEIQAGLGVRFFGDKYSGTFEWLRTYGRDTLDADSLMFTLRADF